MSLVRFKNRVSQSFIVDILEHIKKLPLSFFFNINPSYLSDRISADCTDMVSFITDTIVNFIANFFSFILYFYLIYIIYPKILFSLILLIPIYVITYLLFRTPLYKVSYKYREVKNILSSKIVQQLYNIKFIKTNSLFNEVKNDFIKSYEEGNLWAVKCVRLSTLLSSSDSFIKSLINIILFFYGGIQILNNNLTIGEFTILNKYISMILVSIAYFLNFGQSYQKTLSAYSRICNLLDREIEINGNNIINQINQISLDKVNFKYSSNEILKDFSYKFEKGKIYTLCGKNGAGKSTIINLMIGLLDNYEGNIYYDNNNIKDINLYNARFNIVSVVDQSPKFLNDTIKTNLSYNKSSINNNEIMNFFKQYNWEEFINKLPNNLESVLESNLISLSEGEKQKLSLIRAFIKSPQVLILDEPTTSLDIASISSLKENLLTLKENMIIIIVSHDLDFMDISDKIINI